MKRCYTIAGVMVILALAFDPISQVHAHGPGGRGGRSAPSPVRTAVAGIITATAPQYVAQLGAQNTVAQAVAQRTAALYSTGSGGAAIQQSTLPIRTGSAIAAQLVGNSAARAALTAQVAAANPRLSPQEAAVVADREISAYVTQQQVASQSAAQNAAQNGVLTPQQAALQAAYTSPPYIVPPGVNPTNPFATIPQESAPSDFGATNPSLNAVGPGLNAIVPSAGIDTTSATLNTPGFRQSLLDASGQYQPALPSPPLDNGGGSYSYSGAAETAPSLALQGTAQVLSAAGQYELNSSAAAVNLTEAEKRAMRNQVQAVQTYWEMRKLGRAERSSELGPRPQAEDLARRARAGAPRALSASEIDPVSGALYWPGALQDDVYQESRLAVNEYTAKWVKYGGLNYSDRTHMRENISAMFDTLKSQINEIAPQEYLACRSFLQSLLYSTTHAII